MMEDKEKKTAIDPEDEDKSQEQLIEERLSDRLRPDKEHMYEMAVKKKNKIDLS